MTSHTMTGIMLMDSQSIPESERQHTMQQKMSKCSNTEQREVVNQNMAAR